MALLVVWLLANFTAALTGVLSTPVALLLASLGVLGWGVRDPWFLGSGEEKGQHEFLGLVAGQIPWLEKLPSDPFTEGSSEGLRLRITIEGPGSYGLLLRPDARRSFWSAWPGMTWGEGSRGLRGELAIRLLPPEPRRFLSVWRQEAAFTGDNQSFYLAPALIMNLFDMVSFVKQAAEFGQAILDVDEEQMMERLCDALHEEFIPELSRIALELLLELYKEDAARWLPRLEQAIAAQAEEESAALLQLAMLSIEEQLAPSFYDLAHQHPGEEIRFLAALKDPRESGHMTRLLALGSSDDASLSIRREVLESLSQRSSWSQRKPLLRSFLESPSLELQKLALKHWFGHGLRGQFGAGAAPVQSVFQSVIETTYHGQIQQLCQGLAAQLPDHQDALHLEDWRALLEALLLGASPEFMRALALFFQEQKYLKAGPALARWLGKEQVWLDPREEHEVKLEVIVALEEIGGIEAIETLLHYRDQGPTELRDPAERAIAQIQSRLKPTEQGGLSLAEAPERGQLSLSAEAGRLALSPNDAEDGA